MSLYLATPGVADPVKFSSSMTAIDLACLRALGTGVLSGLTVDGTGHLQPGEALYGHVVALAAAADLAPQLVASSTNYVYLQMPAAPLCVGTDGKDVGVIAVNQTGAAPVNSVLLATVTTGAGSAITSVNNAPAGRRNLAAPLQGQTLITLAAKTLTLTPGDNYLVGVDFSAAGTFADGMYRAGCTCGADANLVVGEALGQKAAGKMFFTLHYPATIGGVTSTTPVDVHVTAQAKGEGFTGLTLAGIVGTWDALVSF